MLRLVVEVKEAISGTDLIPGDVVLVELLEDGGGIEVTLTRKMPAGFLYQLLPAADSPSLRLVSSSPPSLPLYLRELARMGNAQAEEARRFRVVR